MEFQVGDKIIIHGRVPYVFTKDKSTGVVTDVTEGQVLVDFDYLSCAAPPSGRTEFWIDIQHCKPLAQIPQQERICNKIKLMESRWVAFQARKQEWNCHV